MIHCQNLWLKPVYFDSCFGIFSSFKCPWNIFLPLSKVFKFDRPSQLHTENEWICMKWKSVRMFFCPCDSFLSTFGDKSLENGMQKTFWSIILFIFFETSYRVPIQHFGLCLLFLLDVEIILFFFRMDLDFSLIQLHSLKAFLCTSRSSFSCPFINYDKCNHQNMLKNKYTLLCVKEEFQAHKQIESIGSIKLLKKWYCRIFLQLGILCVRQNVSMDLFFFLQHNI